MAVQQTGQQVTIAWEADRWTIYLSGELDLARRGDIVNVAEVLADRRALHVTIDLANVTFCDTAGYQSIGHAAALIESGGGRVRVVNLRPAADRVQRAPLLAAG